MSVYCAGTMPESAMDCPVTDPDIDNVSTMSDVCAKFVTKWLNLVICSRKALCEPFDVDFADNTDIFKLVAVFSEK